MSNSDDNTLHFEEKFGEFSKLGTLIIKGDVDKISGNINGEIGVKAFGTYKSLKPFAGNIHDGVHDKFATGVGFGDSSFSIGIEDGAVKAQANLWEKGVNITLFKLEQLPTTWRGFMQYDPNERGNDETWAIFVVDGQNYIFKLGPLFPCSLLNTERPVAATGITKFGGQRGSVPEGMYVATFRRSEFRISLDGDKVLITGAISSEPRYIEWITKENECATIQGRFDFIQVSRKDKSG